MAVQFINGTTTLNAAVLNKLLIADGTGLGYACVAVWVYYDGAAWVCSSARGTVDQASNLAFNWNTNKLEIDITGLDNPFTAAPAVFTTLTTGSTRNMAAHATSTDNVDVVFYDYNSATAETTEDTEMSFYLFMLGSIA